MAGGADGAIGARRGGRRALDFDVNMVPMIDLLMVTISFLLITAVWVEHARLPADALAPGVGGPTPPEAETARLHLEMTDAQRFVLHWDVGRTVIRSREVARAEVVTTDRGERTVRFPGLASALGEEESAAGAHRDPGDPAFDELVVHAGDDVPYASLIGAIDAAYDVRRACPTGSAAGAKTCRAFHVTFAAR